MEMADQILKTLMETDKHRGIFFSLRPVLERQHPNVSQARAAKIMAFLEEKGFISTSTRKTKNVPHFVRINPAAYAYFQSKEERRTMVELARLKAAERPRYVTEEVEHESWNPGTILIAYAVGLISGILLMWIKGS